jgi:hypothetical protein
VDVDVLTVNTLEQVGLHPLGPKFAVAPVGRGETPKEMDCEPPTVIRVAVIVVEPLAPWSTLMSPDLDNE